jgi:hypothetical protein
MNERKINKNSPFVFENLAKEVCMFILNSFIKNIDDFFLFSFSMKHVQLRVNFGKTLFMKVHQKNKDFLKLFNNKKNKIYLHHKTNFDYYKEYYYK